MTLGPLAVALLTESVFRTPNAVGISLGIVAPTALALGAFILWLGLAAYRRVLAANTPRAIHDLGSEPI
jgi:hypothetical protein